MYTKQLGILPAMSDSRMSSARMDWTVGSVTVFKL